MPADEDVLESVAAIVAAYVENNSVPQGEMAALIASVHQSVARIAAPAEPEAPVKPEPAVNPKRSIFPDYLICLDDGKRFKSLKRHLTLLGMTPDEYRAKWGLPSDYPMVAPNYAAARSELAKKAGLGRKKVAPPTPLPTPAKSGRKRAAIK